MPKKRDRNNIEGIFNYCDRWCERCGYTSRCGSFALGEEMERQDKACDEESRKFWEMIDRSCEETLAKAESADASYNPGPTGFGDDLEHELEGEIAKNHPCVERAHGYIGMADAWFKDPGLEAGHAPTPVSMLDDALQVARWYQRLIYVKVLRAINGLQRHPEDFGDLQSDSNGSVKVALMGIDRSIGAWGILLRQVPEYKRETNGIILHLAGLRRMIEETFPEARAFVRPGFDTGVRP